MCPRMTIALTLPTLRALLDYHAEQGSDLDPADLADLAIRDWLTRQRCPSGYWWKTVLLPDGTRLRISSLHRTYYAAIVGAELVYDGHSMSPNQFASACLGTARNAWEAIYAQLPGERDWKQATRLRHAAAAQARRAANRHAAATAP